MNPVLVRRFPWCVICKSVTAIEDVNVRICNEDGTLKRGYVRTVNDYLGSCGQAPRSRALISKHAKHVQADLLRPPSEIHPDEMAPLVPSYVPASWFDVQEQAMEVGMEALRGLVDRLPSMEDKDAISVAKLGLTAAVRRADQEQRGRALGATITALGMISSGHARQVAARVGGLTVIAELGEGSAGVTVDAD